MDTRTIDSFQKYASWFEDARQGNITRIEEWVNANRIWIDFPDQKGNSALYYAIEHGHHHVIQFLIGEGAHFYENFNNKSPWDVAARQVKTYLENLDPRPKIESLETLIEQEVLELPPLGQDVVLKFILSLPEKYRSQFLQNERDEII